MTRWSSRFRVVVAVLFAGLVLAGAGVLMVLAGLENADRISSVIGAAAGVLGLGVSGFGAVRARNLRAASREPDDPGISPVAKDISMKAEAKDNARIYQSGGDMTVDDR